MRHALKKLTEKGPQPNIYLQIKKKDRIHFITAAGKWRTFNDRKTMEQLVPGILHLETAQGMSRLHLLAHLNYSGPEFHPDNRKKNISRTNQLKFVTFKMRYSTRTFSLLTRSKTRENSGVLRVFKGSAGLRVNCSSVRGGTCLMKKYLKAEKP